jgi:hypothetical protein
MVWAFFVCAMPIGTTFIYRTAKLSLLSPRLFKGDESRRIAADAC